MIERQRTLSDPAQAISNLAAVVGTRVSYPTLTAISALVTSGSSSFPTVAIT